MAEKKEKNVAAEETKAAKPSTTKEKTVKVMIPRQGKNDGDVFVSINERTWLIKRGVEVEVPECVAEQLTHQMRMLDEAYEYEAAARG